MPQQDRLFPGLQTAWLWEDCNVVWCPQGSRELWLDAIMSQIAEVLRLQDLPTIQIVVASLGMTYPDLR